MIMTFSSQHAGEPSACHDDNVMIIASGGLTEGRRSAPYESERTQFSSNANPASPDFSG
jgi:hypothetical protein